MKIYSVYDKKALTYSPVISMPNDVMAIRMIEMEVMRGQSPMANYPFDFCLVHLADMDDTTGKITVLDVPANIYECANAAKRGKENE